LLHKIRNQTYLEVASLVDKVFTEHKTNHKGKIMKSFRVEFDGFDYVVLGDGKVIASFSSLHDAYQAKQEFAEKKSFDQRKKIPPAMQRLIYGDSSHDDIVTI
jgi:hypothetical protein